MKIGIIGAMEVEVASLREMLENSETQTVAGMEAVSGTLFGVPAVVVKCGVGKVNAAICVQFLVDRFGVTHIINTGVAGSVAPGVGIGDIVVSREVLYHDVDVVGLGYEKGLIPGEASVAFAANDELADAAVAAATESIGHNHVFDGRIVTGDQFISSADERKRIRRETGAFCTEMEGAAIAQAAGKNGIPFVVIRVISDHANGQSVEDYPAFEAASAETCAQLTAALVKHIGKRLD